MDKRTRRAIDEALDGFTAGRDGKHYRDLEAAAVYRIEPAGAEAIALACIGCKVVTIKPGAPTRDELVMLCSNCGRPWTLKPPPEVVAFGRTGLTIVGIDDPTPHAIPRLN